jgi:glycosyltransferase involved in cell wall biosynthesis
MQLGKSDEFRRENGLADDFLVTYAGIMSWPQDLETIVDSASLLRNYNDIKFLLVGDGPQRGLLEEKSKKLGIKNLQFLPLQPREAYLKIIRASDVCFVSLKKDFRSPAVPSKLLDIMAYGRPAIANVPLEGDAPKIIMTAKCGLCVVPQNPEALRNAILDLYNSPHSRRVMGKNAKRYFKDHFSLKSCMMSYEKIFAEVTSKAIADKNYAPTSL